MLMETTPRAGRSTSPLRWLSHHPVALLPPLLWGLLVVPVGAAAQDEQSAQMGEIVVTSPFRHTTEELVRATDVLDGQALDRRRQGTIGDVLSDQPGISSSSFGPGAGRPVIRGLGGPRVMILDNGIRTMDASTVSADHAVALDPLGAERIEILKGPATLLYGGGAVGGVINVVDGRLSDRLVPGLRLGGDFSYGSNADERNTALSARYGEGAWKLGVDYSRRSSNEFSIPGHAVRLTDAQVAGEAEAEDVGPWNKLDNSNLRTERYGISAGRVDETGTIAAAVTRFETNYGIAGHAHEHEHDHGHDHGHGHDDHAVRIDLKQTRVDLRAMLNAPFAGFERIELRTGVNDYEHVEVEGGAVGTVFDVTESEARLELEHKPLAEWTGVGGLQLSARDFEAVGLEAFVPPVVTRELGVFLIEHRPLGAHRVEFGARIDHVRHRPDDPGSGVDPARLVNSSHSPASLSAGVVFNLREHLHLRVNAQRAQRAPGAEEQYAFGPHLATGSFERGDPQMDLETANNLDVALARDAGMWTWKLGVFYNRIDDYIFPEEVDEGLNADGSGTPSADGESDRVNEDGSFDPDGSLLLLDYAQKDAEFYGVEAQLGVTLIDTGWWRLALNGFGDFTRGRLAQDDENLPRMPPMRYGFGAEAAMGPLSGGIRYQRAREQDRPGALETATPGHDLLSADLAYALPLRGTRSASLYLQGRNLLDEKVRLSTSFLKDEAPQPGRSILVGLRFDFDA